MTANRRLGALRGIPESVLCEIDKMHEQNEEFIRQAVLHDAPRELVHEYLTMADFDLQLAWGFPMDKNYHTLCKLYDFRKSWYGRKFQCVETGEIMTIPIDVYEGAVYHVGKGAVDVGRHKAYSRIIGNVFELKREEV